MRGLSAVSRWVDPSCPLMAAYLVLDIQTGPCLDQQAHAAGVTFLCSRDERHSAKLQLPSKLERKTRGKSMLHDDALHLPTIMVGCASGIADYGPRPMDGVSTCVRGPPAFFPISVWMAGCPH